MRDQLCLVKIIITLLQKGEFIEWLSNCRHTFLQVTLREAQTIHISDSALLTYGTLSSWTTPCISKRELEAVGSMRYVLHCISWFNTNQIPVLTNLVILTAPHICFWAPASSN